MKDFDAEVKLFISSNHAHRDSAEKAVFMLPTFGTDLPHNPKTLSGFDTVDLIRVHIIYYCFDLKLKKFFFRISV